MSQFGIKKKLKNVAFFIFKNFFCSLLTRTGSDMFLPAYSQLNKINQSINPCNLKGGRYTSSSLRLYYGIDNFLSLIKSPYNEYSKKLALFFFF